MLRYERQRRSVIDKIILFECLIVGGLIGAILALLITSQITWRYTI